MRLAELHDLKWFMNIPKKRLVSIFPNEFLNKCFKISKSAILQFRKIVNKQGGS